MAGKVPMGAYTRLETRGHVHHPLIQYLSQRLAALQELVEFECDGQPVQFDGYRLRDLSPWAVSPSASLMDNFGSLSGFCNVRCSFCYEYGNPLPYDLTMLGLAEARTRARYYDAEERRGLLPFSTRLDLEPFTNPWLIEILRELRRHDRKHVISLTTNGARLDRAMVEQLAELAPIHLVVSVNNADPKARRELMRDGHAEVAVQAAGLLREHGIPFTGGIVAWPDTSDMDLRRTIRHYDECDARAIRVSLPSYSGYFSGGKVLFDTDAEWDRLFALVEEEADRIETPISAAPYLPRGVAIAPRVSGVIRRSPAARAGIRRGDMVVLVEDEPVRSRMHAKRLLSRHGAATRGRVRIEIERAGQRWPLVLEDRATPDEDLYPYKPRGYAAPSAGDEAYGSLFGLFLNDDIDPDDLLSVIEVARKRDARSVAVMSSHLLEGVVLEYLSHNPTLVREAEGLDLYVVSPRHSFWGGNIVVGDLYLCQDYVACLQRLTARLGQRPDLAVIPMTFSPNHWTDLAGIPYSEIELRTGVPVELVPCRRIIV